MKYTHILALIIALAMVFTIAHSLHMDDSEYIADDYEELPYQDGEEDIYSFLDQIETEQQFLATFNPEEYAEDMLIADEIKSSDSFQIRRASSIQMQYGLDVHEYDAIHSETLLNLITVATLLRIDYNPYTTTYDDIMYLINRNLMRTTTDVQQEVLDLLQDIRPNAYVFENRHTLLDAEDEDAMLQAIIHLDKAINWLINKVRSNKCTYCFKIIGYVRKRACGSAGTAVCNLISKVGGAFAGTIKKYGCGSPVNFASKLGTLCNNALKYFTKNTKASDRNICRNVKLPTLSWKTHSNVFYKITGKTVNFGTAC